MSKTDFVALLQSDRELNKWACEKVARSLREDLKLLDDTGKRGHRYLSGMKPELIETVIRDAENLFKDIENSGLLK